MRTLLITAAVLLFASCCPKTTDKSAGSAEVTPDTATQNETKMIRLNVTVTTTADNLAEVVEGLNALAAASRAEAGCEGYEIYQSTIEPTRLMIIETWAGDAALSAHQKTPHYTTILPPLGEKMSLDLQRFEY
jgi:quinol monooxygenase YgiN